MKSTDFRRTRRQRVPHQDVVLGLASRGATRLRNSVAPRLRSETQRSRSDVARRSSLITGLLLAVLGFVMPSIQAAEVSSHACVGLPFGVAVVMQSRVADKSLKDWDAPFEISDAEGRILYPARLVVALSDAAPNAPNYEIRDYFLFRGEEPLTLKTVDGEPIGVTIEPRHDGPKHRRLLEEWWQARLGRRQQLNYLNAAMPLVADFTNAMLARRLNLAHKQPPSGSQSGLDTGIGFLLGTESIRAALQAERLLETGAEPAQVADQPLPEGVGIPAVPVPAIPEGVEIEPLAQHVPAECFYLRCGSYSNLAWVRRTFDQWGSNLRDIINRRGIDYAIQQRFEQQLALRETEVVRLIGNVVIKDIALIGFDDFVREGAAIGVLIESEKGVVLRAGIAEQRAMALAAHPQATVKTVVIAGRNVQLLATPDHRLRSFLAVDGNFHLVTNSKELVRRFFEAGAGREPLAALDEFRYARAQHPLSEPAVAFLHLSDNFFRNLLSPKYRVEMTRRGVADVDIENLELARLAAKAEGAKVESLDDLFRLGFLPGTAARRPDGSQIVQHDGQILDSQRGARGYFVPVADVDITHITAREVAAYAQFKRQYAAVWERVDPVTINVVKEPVLERPDRERVVLSIRICPIARQKYGLVETFIDPPQTKRLASVPGAIAEIQSHLKKAIGAEHILLGVLDDESKFVVQHGAVVPAETEKLDRTLFLIVNDNNFLKTNLEQAKRVGERDYHLQQAWFPWIRKEGELFIGSSSQAMLDRIAPHVKTEPAARPAQIRMRVADLSLTKAFQRLTAEAYANDARISVGAASFLNELTQQFRLAPSEAQAAAERVLNGKVICLLGGELKHDAATNDFARWRSSRLPAGRMHAVNSVPADYRCPILERWHGLDLEFLIENRTLQVRAEFELTAP